MSVNFINGLSDIEKRAALLDELLSIDKSFTDVPGAIGVENLIDTGGIKRSIIATKVENKSRLGTTAEYIRIRFWASL